MGVQRVKGTIFLFLILALLLSPLFSSLIPIQPNLHQVQSYFQQAEASLSQGRIHEGERLLQQGLFLLHVAVPKAQNPAAVLATFSAGEDLYLKLKNERGELRELTEGLFQILREFLQDLLEEEGEKST